MYLVLCAVWLMVRAFSEALGGSESAAEKVKNMFLKQQNAVLLAAIASTVGIYLLASFIYVGLAAHFRD